MSNIRNRRLKIFLVCLCLSIFLIPNLTHADNTEGTAISKKESTGSKDQGYQISNLYDDTPGLPKAMGTGKKAMICGTTGKKAIYAGLDVLKQGGSAVDAALTTALAQIVLRAGSVVSFAGFMDMVYYEASTGKTYSIGAGFNTLQEENDPLSIPMSSLLTGGNIRNAEPGPKGRTVLVPGFMAGVEAAHKRFGKLPFEKIFEPAIELAEKGFPWTSRLNGWFNIRKDILSRLDETKAVFTKENGEYYDVGDLFTQPELAKTLKSVAKEGVSYMYTGEWAKKLVRVVQSEGGKLTMKDLADYQVEWYQPLVVNYHGYDINLFHEADCMASMLNILEAADIAGMGHYTESPESFFWFTQIMKAVLDNYYDKPWLNKEKAKLIWDQMRKGEFEGVTSVKDDSPRHSAGIVAVDEEGNVAALIHTSSTAIWGENGIFIDGVSIPDFASLRQREIKDIGPGKRLHTGIPILIAMKDGKPIVSLSCVGSGLFQEVPKVLVNMIDFNMNPKEANDAASFLPPSQTQERVPQNTFSPKLLERVREMGMKIEEIPQQQSSGQVVNIRIDPENGNLEGAVPLSLDGIALGY